MENYAEETMEIAAKANIQEKFLEEVKRLLTCGAVDQTDHSRGFIIGVALENLADNWLRGDRKTKNYRNIKRF